MVSTQGAYYVPHGSHWPMVGSWGLFFLLVGFALKLNDSGFGSFLMLIGAGAIVVMMFGWFSTVVRESESGMYNNQVDRSFRWGMAWFIFSEVMFFAAFFGALFYTRVFTLPWLGGEEISKLMTHALLWPGFEAIWPTVKMPDPTGFTVPEHAMHAWGIPALNTLILLSSGVTVTWAHWGLKQNNRQQLIYGLLVTVILGFLFVSLQAYEYTHAYTELNLKLSSGIYGSVFFMLTGFHGLHVTIGAIMLSVMLLRSIKGHFTAENHFAFEAAAWYWHFVDVVWLGLFIFVYWL
jgi:cytochrome c oxidase subunit 3